MTTIYVEKIDNVYCRIRTDSSIHYELRDHFTFKVPDAKFTPAYKNKIWDGTIKLYNVANQTLLCGLYQQLCTFAKQSGYDVVSNSFNKPPKVNLEIIAQQIAQEIQPTSDGESIEPYDFQLEAISQSLSSKRCIIVSATSSGKSLIIYCMARLIQRFVLQADQKVLIVVPTIGLVNQMYADFEDYSSESSWSAADNVQKIMGGMEKTSNKQIVISTWQSIFRMPKSFFQPFVGVIGDECHTFKAKSLDTIMKNLTNAKYRIGLTGTLEDSKTNVLMLVGLFGPVYTVVKSHQLIADGKASKLDIKCVVLKYDGDTRKLFSKARYHDELDMIESHGFRNKLITKLAREQSSHSNTLVLFNKRKHGKLLFDTLRASSSDHPTFYVDGTIDPTLRERIRHYTEQSNHVIIVASYKTFSTGINIKNLNTLIMAAPTKSKIRVLQSIGRLLRVGDVPFVTLFDVADDLSWKSATNHTLQHFLQRLGFYDKEKFNYKVHKIMVPGNSDE